MWMYIASYVPSYVACYVKLSCNLPLYLGSSYVHACKPEPNMLKISFQHFPKNYLLFFFILKS